jgi:UDP-2-acetamido-3-amino-2,3-dideoxy-glucuronate N-acetyltransferase
MKIDRVILSTNFNSLYYDFWNNLSKLYKLKYDIIPTLIFLGTDEELKLANLSTEYGDIIRVDYPNGKDVWVCTWALFYYTKYFINDICLIMGIDQIPMGTYFIKDIISEYEDDAYIMLIDDAYKITSNVKKWDEGGYSPSAYHIAKGSTFRNIYKFDDNFEKEIDKIESMNLKNLFGDGLWGLDETYTSKILRESIIKYKIIGLSKFDEILKGKRLDCHRSNEPNYNLEQLNNNYYIECHSCRPYKDHKEYLDNLFYNILNSNFQMNKYFKHDTSIVETNKIGKGTKIWAFSHISTGVEIGENCVIGEGVHIGKNVIIGNNCKIQNHSLIYEGVIIENNVFLGPNTVTTNDYMPNVSENWIESGRFKKTIFKNGCSVGANSVIICGVIIGENSLIGAGSVVTKNIPNKSISYGNPSKLIRYFD